MLLVRADADLELLGKGADELRCKDEGNRALLLILQNQAVAVLYCKGSNGEGEIELLRGRDRGRGQRAEGEPWREIERSVYQ